MKRGPSLLARFAGNIYWLARYMERAENLARILDINETYARDSAGGPDWQRVLELYADTERFAEAYEETNAASVISFYVLDVENPTSLYNAVHWARENARSVRHLISNEMWAQLNLFYNQFGEMDGRTVRPSTLSPICADIKQACQTFEGIAEGTFFRGEPWTFYQLGKHLERADQTTRILDMGFGRVADEDGEAIATVQWQVLLRSVAGYHAFRALYPASLRPQDIAAFLLYDRGFPRAVASCLDRVSTCVQSLAERHGRPAASKRDNAPEDARRRLAFVLETGLGHRVTPKGLHRFLDQLQKELGGVSDAIRTTYFS